MQKISCGYCRWLRCHYSANIRMLQHLQGVNFLSSNRSVVCEESPQLDTTSDKVGVHKVKLQVTTPQLSENTLKELNTAVGVHIGVNFMSWAMLDCSGKLLEWDMMDLMSSGNKKMHPTKLFEQAMEMKHKLPTADVYVFEDKASGSQQSQQQQATIFLTSHQLSAMLLVLLNLDYNTTGGVEHLLEHRVYFLRSRLSARLFRTIIGSERVSSQNVVQDILSLNNPSPNYSDISVPYSLHENYLSSNSVQQENLCRSLLLVMTFMELAVNKNPHALNFVTSRSK